MSFGCDSSGVQRKQERGCEIYLKEYQQLKHGWPEVPMARSFPFLFWHLICVHFNPVFIGIIVRRVKRSSDWLLTLHACFPCLLAVSLWPLSLFTIFPALILMCDVGLATYSFSFSMSLVPHEGIEFTQYCSSGAE